MPKGQQRKIKGAICNIPVECDKTCNQLPRAPERSGIAMLKLKRKLQFRGHVYFQAVRPDLLQEALYWLKANNLLYKDIVVEINNIEDSLLSLIKQMNKMSRLMQVVMLHNKETYQQMTIVIHHMKIKRKLK